MKTILCPTDFSPNANSAAEYASSLANILNARMILFHAYEEPVLATETAVPVMEEIKTNLRLVAEKKLKTQLDNLRKYFPKISISTELAKGSGYKEIVDAANRTEADLIVMGTTGSGRIERLLIGSTTARILKNAKCPVICIPKEVTYNKIKKIVFATDLEKDNLSAAITITHFAATLGAEIIFVFVDKKHLLHDESNILHMTQKIKSRVKYPKISGYVANNPNIASGIEYFSKKYDADLLVMYAHDKSFTETLLHPSVTKQVSNKIDIPLLVLKQDNHFEL